MDVTQIRNHPESIWMTDRNFRSKYLTGKPGYINFLDAFNGWQLVSESESRQPDFRQQPLSNMYPRQGHAVGLPLTETLAKIYWVDDMTGRTSLRLACAYARARGADRMSSFGDFISLSDVCDARYRTADQERGI